MKIFNSLVISVITFMLLIGSAKATEFHECPIGKAETLVCSVIMCGPGLLIAESRPKCLKINRKFAMYLATLGFWSKPPSCKSRDANCNVTGKATAKVDPSSCEALDDPNDIATCLAAGGFGTIPDDCDKFTNVQKFECRGRIDPRNRRKTN
jgi:hypothetical protein